MELPEEFSLLPGSNPIRYIVREASHQLHSAQPARSHRVPVPSVPMMMRHLAWQKLDSKEGEKVA